MDYIDGYIRLLDNDLCHKTRSKCQEKHEKGSKNDRRNNKDNMWEKQMHNNSPLNQQITK